MNKKLYKSQLAKALGVTNASVTMAIKRGKLVTEKDNIFIDIENPLNKLWIESQEAKGKKFDLNRIYNKNNQSIKKKSDKDDPDTAAESISVDDYEDTPTVQSRSKRADLTLKKLEKELRKFDNEDKLKKLEIKKKEGALLPADETKHVFNWAIETFKNTFIQELQSLIAIYGNKKKYNKISKEIYDIIEIISNQAKENILNGITGIVEEYKEVRGRGEKK